MCICPGALLCVGRMYHMYPPPMLGRQYVHTQVDSSYMQPKFRSYFVWIGTKVKPDFPKSIPKWPPPICSQLYISFGGSLLSSSSSSTHQPRLRVSIMPITAYATYAMISLLPLCGNSHTACMPASPHRHVRPGAIRSELFAIECRSID